MESRGQMVEDDPVVENDPVLGTPIAYYPGDRGRLVLIGGGAYAVVAMLINIAFLPVEASTAAIGVVTLMSLLALVVGWWITHQWNREVVLYAGGFTYHEGSRTVYFSFAEIRKIHFYAERRSYFFGVIKRTIRRLTLTTERDETLILTNLYRRLDELAERIEVVVNRLLRPELERRMASGEKIAFGEGLALSSGGVYVDDAHLAWAECRGYTVRDRRLTLQGSSGALSVPLAGLYNVTLLLDMLNARLPKAAHP